VADITTDFEKEILTIARLIEHFGDPRLALDINKLLADGEEIERKVVLEGYHPD